MHKNRRWCQQQEADCSVRLGMTAGLHDYKSMILQMNHCVAKAG